MDNILPFQKTNLRKVLVVKPDTNNLLKQFLYLGSWEFTCPHCQRHTRFNASGMIFRTVEFYCDKCGVLHKVANPAFTSSK